MSEPPNGCERPAIEPTTEAKKRKFSTAPATSALTEEIALPTLRDSSSASSLRFATIASASACSSRARSFGGVLPHGPSSAARAASTARSTSASPAMAARASGSPVAGSCRSRIWLDAEPEDEIGILVPIGGADGELFHQVEGIVFSVGAPFVPIEHEGVIYIRPPVG